jgi:hypothetical protein
VVSTIGGPGHGSSTDDPSQAGERGPVPNPGKGLGIAAVVLSVLVLWPVGLPLAIVSWVRSARAGASVAFGVVGTALNVLSAVVSVALAVSMWWYVLASLAGIQVVPEPVPAEQASSAPIGEETSVTDPGLVTAHVHVV